MDHVLKEMFKFNFFFRLHNFKAVLKHLDLFRSPYSGHNQRFQENIILILLILSTLIVYRDIGSHEFINYDDPIYISENVNIQDGLTLKNIVWAFTTFHGANWHPITWLSHMLDIELFGLNAGFHHLINLLIHICNVLLSYVLFRRSTDHIYKSAILAALFAVHPLHIESVAWISQRKNLLCAFFWLVSMITYCHYSRRPSIARYVFPFICFILGSLSKPMMVTFPFVLLLFDYWPLNRHIHFYTISNSYFKNSLFWLFIEKIPFIIVSMAMSYVTLLAQSKGGAIGEVDVLIRIGNAIAAYAFYIKKIIWPADLAILYPFKNPSVGVFAVCFMLIAGITALAIVFRRKHAYLMVGWLWYLGTLIPVIGIVQVGVQSMADRYTYIPSIGLFVALIWGVSAVIKRFVIDKFLRTAFIWALTVTTLALMMLLSGSQIRYWQNSVTLMTNAVQITDGNYVAHENLGLTLAERGLYDEALHHFKQAISINPNFANAYMNIGSYYLLHGEYDSAIQYYQKAIDIESGLTKAKLLLDKALKAKEK